MHVNAIDFLSLWDLAHRWHGYDPNLTDETKLPLPVQDTLRMLTRSAMFHHVPLCSETGHVYKTDDYFVGRFPDTYEEYLNLVRFQNEATEGFENCYLKRIFKKEILDDRYVTHHSLESLCKCLDIPMPDFWKSSEPNPDIQGAEGPQQAESDTEKNLPIHRRQSHIDQEICQAIAQTLWDIDPSIPIAQMCQHRAIQIYGNGKLYKGKHTLRNWLKNFAPNNRPGRPPKTPPTPEE